MTNQRKWLWIGGAVAVAAAAVALGVPLGTVILVALVLLCPAMMYFGMRQGHGHERMTPPADRHGQEQETTDRERPASPNQVGR